MKRELSEKTLRETNLIGNSFKSEMTQVASLVDKNEKQKIVLIAKKSSKEKNLSERRNWKKEVTKELVKKNLTFRRKNDRIDCK